MIEPKTIPVMLACNDRNGTLSKLTAVQVGHPNGIELEGDLESGEELDFLTARGIHCDDLLAINHGDDFHYIRGTHKRHVGNIHWDEIQMTPENAAKLTNYLMQKPHWNLMVAPAQLWDCVQRCRLS